MTDTNKLSSFVEDILEKIQSNTLDYETKLELIDFYTRCTYKNINNDVNNLDDSNVVKFLCMGWYIYNELESKKV